MKNNKETDLLKEEKSKRQLFKLFTSLTVLIAAFLIFIAYQISPKFISDEAFSIAEKQLETIAYNYRFSIKQGGKKMFILIFQFHF